MEARLGQDSSNSSRPPSSDLPHTPRRRHVSPTGRRRGGQPGHPGRFRSLLPVEQVDEVVVVVPEHCRYCQRPFPGTGARRHGRPRRHQVVELPPLAMRVTEYRMVVRRCPMGHRVGPRRCGFVVRELTRLRPPACGPRPGGRRPRPGRSRAPSASARFTRRHPERRRCTRRPGPGPSW
jgi:hypothetical protein